MTKAAIPENPKEVVEKALAAINAGEMDDERIYELFMGVDGDGRNFFMYLAVKPSLYTDYKQKTEAGEAIEFLNYGEILEWGYAVVPPKEVQQKMAEKYGLQHDLEERLRDGFE